MFLVIEIQTGQTISAINNSYNNRADAESKYHQILQAAALSSVPKHGAVLLADTGELIKNEFYEHD